jgi:hypothetical protein
MSRCKLSFAKSLFVVDPARGTGAPEIPRNHRQRAVSASPKSRGITAKERYLREAYIEVRCSDEG